jgi:hypothetical protein
MALTKIPYKTLKSLLNKRKLFTREDEDAETQRLFVEFKKAKKRGYLKKSELEEICYWKSPRAIHLIRSNHEDKIKSKTSQAFKTRSERQKLNLLTSLKGVSIPMASSILMLTDPKRYGVIDIRVWQLLFRLGTVNTNPEGKNFGFNEWYRFLMIIRYFAKKFKVRARDIERILFDAHSDYQKGRLYES